MSRRALGGVLAVAVVALGLPPPAAARTAELTWEAAFPVAGAKSELYLDAHFIGTDGADHRLQLWRRGADLLHRRTDEALDLYVQKGAADYDYRLVDHRRHLLIGVNRNHLYRIGVFSDWFALAHVLDRPKTGFHVRAAAPLPGERRGDCAWRLLERSPADRTRVCWSAEWGLPLIIRAPGPKGTWKESFRIDRLEEGAIPDRMVLPDLPEGYAYFDAGKAVAPEAGD